MKTIIVPTDFTPIAERAYVPAAFIASQSHSKIVFLHNVQTLLLWSSLSQKEQMKHEDIIRKTYDAETNLNAVIERPEFQNISCESRITHGLTYEQVVLTAKQLKADLIVLGSHTDLPGKSFIDSTIQKVMLHAYCPVMMIGQPLKEFQWKKVLVPLSFDENVHKAFKGVHDLALTLSSTVHLLYINRPERFKETSKVEAQMKEFTAQYPDLTFEFGHLDSLEIEGGILEYVDRLKPDYVAMVTHDRRHHPKYLVSTTETIAYHADIPVLSVPILKELPVEIGISH